MYWPRCNEKFFRHSAKKSPPQQKAEIFCAFTRDISQRTAGRRSYFSLLRRSGQSTADVGQKFFREGREHSAPPGHDYFSPVGMGAAHDYGKLMSLVLAHTAIDGKAEPAADKRGEIQVGIGVVNAAGAYSRRAADSKRGALVAGSFQYEGFAVKEREVVPLREGAGPGGGRKK